MGKIDELLKGCGEAMADGHDPTTCACSGCGGVRSLANDVAGGNATPGGVVKIIEATVELATRILQAAMGLG